MYSPSHLEVAILNYLNENDITVPIKGVLQETMYENDDQISSYSMSAVYKALSNLVSRNIVALGMRYGRSYSYYLTPTGVTFFRELSGIERGRKKRWEMKLDLSL